MNFSTENTTHEEVVRLLNDRDAKMVDLYNTITATQMANVKLTHELMGAKIYSTKLIEEKQKALFLLLAAEKEITEGEISRSLPVNPFSLTIVKHIRNFFEGQ